MAERLQKILSQAGIASRRAAEKLIAEGRVAVNGTLVTEPGCRADIAEDDITVDGKSIHGREKKVYFLLNKPKGYISTASDDRGRKIVLDLLACLIHALAHAVHGGTVYGLRVEDHSAADEGDDDCRDD